MSTARRRLLGHGPQQPRTATAVTRDAQPHVRAVDADVDRTPLRLDVGLDDEFARFRGLRRLPRQKRCRRLGRACPPALSCADSPRAPGGLPTFGHTFETTMKPTM
ncbi:hypothetical protein [Streptomyces noursei]|uniref:hypothetical protein n=1 Tax=Streptomyces noursei TaxID=1971 RepID=UPI0016754FC0|nr:hypothetical protein [Streptomyces noursei]MCZ1021084.1 hypothetical protein [Streptomyces noursei]